MMLQPTKEEYELLNKLEKTTDKNEFEEIQKKLSEISKKKRKELENSNLRFFCH